MPMGVPTGPALRFLFTDNEGSTRLERGAGSGVWATVLGRHGKLLHLPGPADLIANLYGAARAIELLDAAAAIPIDDVIPEILAVPAPTASAPTAAAPIGPRPIASAGAITPAGGSPRDP